MISGGAPGPTPLRFVGPGLLLAATGVGAGDLATAAFTGSVLGTAALWAVVWGAFLKYVLNEGLARWQLATGTTLLEGAAARLGRPLLWAFLPYLVLWSFFVGSALMGACGVTLHAMVPLSGDASTDKTLLGAAAGMLGLVLVRCGGFAVFERVMGACILLVFGTVLATAVLVQPGPGEVLQGLAVPAGKTLAGRGLTWTVALMGGVGGTLTVLCYGYWIAEKGLTGEGHLKRCRLDLALSYAAVAVFGCAMVIVGSEVPATGRGAGLIVDLAARLRAVLGPAGQTLFLIGALAAVFSSLLGVWQAVPYLFADCWRLARGGSPTRAAALRRSRPYRSCQVALALVPAAGLPFAFREMQKLYAVIGAAFMPMLAVALLFLMSPERHVGRRFRNRLPTNLILAATLAFFTWILGARLAALL